MPAVATSVSTITVRAAANSRSVGRGMRPRSRQTTAAANQRQPQSTRHQKRSISTPAEENGAGDPTTGPLCSRSCCPTREGEKPARRPPASPRRDSVAAHRFASRPISPGRRRRYHASQTAPRPASTPPTARTISRCTSPRRMQAVQQPIIPVVGELIRRHPGTISLGQGVVHYGPPPKPSSASPAFWPTRRTTSTSRSKASPSWSRPSSASWPTENGIAAGDCQPRRGHGRRQHGVLQRPAGHRRSGRRDHPAGAVLLQSRDGRLHAQLPARAGAAGRQLPDRPAGRLRQAVTPRTRAIVTISPNNPTGAVYPREALVAVNELCREHGIYHIHDEAYEYFVYERRGTFRPARCPAPRHTRSRCSHSPRPTVSPVGASATWSCPRR